MDKKFIGIVLKSIDYKEKDKLISIFSFDEGLVLGKLKSVKGASAKLKMLSSPFCFAEFTGVQKADKLTITGGDIIESFFDIANDIEAYYAGCCMLDFIYMYLHNDNSEFKSIFKFTVECLKSLCYFGVAPKVVLIRFLLTCLKLLGYALDFTKCVNCGKPIVGCAYIDFIDGGVKCERCMGQKNMEVPVDVVELLVQMSKLSSEGELQQVNASAYVQSECLKILGNYIYLQMSYKIKIDELLKL